MNQHQPSNDPIEEAMAILRAKSQPQPAQLTAWDEVQSHMDIVCRFQWEIMQYHSKDQVRQIETEFLNSIRKSRKRQRYHLSEKIIHHAFSRLWKEHRFIRRTANNLEMYSNWYVTAWEEFRDFMKKRGVLKRDIDNLVSEHSINERSGYLKSHTADQLKRYLSGYFLIVQGRASAKTIDDLFTILQDRVEYAAFLEASNPDTPWLQAYQPLMDWYQNKKLSVVRSSFLHLILIHACDRHEKLGIIERSWSWSFEEPEWFICYLFTSKSRELAAFIRRAFMELLNHPKSTPTKGGGR